MRPLMIAFVFAVSGSLMLAGRAAGGDPDKPVPPIHVTGCRIKPADQVTLSVNQSGLLKSVPRDGDRVQQGQVVIHLEDDLARATLAVATKEAENAIETRNAEISSEVARLEHEQALQLNVTLAKVIAETEVRRLKLTFDRSLLQIELAKHEQAVRMLKRDEAEAQLKAFHIAAPMAGTVTRVLKFKGEAVRQGDPVLELVNTRRVRVEGFVDVAHRRRLVPGTPVQVEVEVIDGETPAARPASGTVVFVDEVAQPVTRQIRIWADVDNEDGNLLPGLTAKMTIVSRPAPLAANR